MKVMLDKTLLSINDYKFLKNVEGKPGRTARVTTRLGKYWIWVAPTTSGYLDCEVMEIHEATKQFVPSREAIVYDKDLVVEVIELATIDNHAKVKG